MKKQFFSMLFALIMLTVITLSSGPLAGNNQSPAKEVLGYYTDQEGVSYDGKIFSIDSSLNTMMNQSNNISMAVPFWFRLDPGGRGDIEFEGYGSMEKEAKDVVSKLKSKNIKVLALIHNMLYTDGISGNALSHEMLSNSSYMDNFIGQLESIMKSYGFDGVNIDIEGVNKADRDNYTKFIKSLKQKLGAKGYLITVSIPAKNFEDKTNSYSYPFDYKGIGLYADRVAIMTYDEHGAWTGSGAGPIASIPWQEDVIKYALTQIPKEKLLMGVPVYGFDWTKGKSWPKYSSYKMSMDTAASNGISVSWDEEAKVPYFKYQDKNGSREVWFENASSFSEKLKLVYKYDLRGIAIWRVGMEDSKIWDVISNQVNVSKQVGYSIFDMKTLYKQGESMFLQFNQDNNLSNYRLEIENENGAKTSQGIDLESTETQKLMPLGDIDDGWYTARVLTDSNGEEIELDSKEFGINCFADIKNHWARNTIINLYKSGYIKGAETDKFKPDNNLTRAEFITLIARVLNISQPSNGFTTKFIDLKNGNHWAAGAITAMEEKGYIGGVEDSKGIWHAAPDEQITRAEMSTILYRVLIKQGIVNTQDGQIGTFSDIKGHWAEESINTLQKLNLINGKSIDKFEPDSKSTRAEAAVIIQRYLDLIKEKGL